MVRRRRGVAAGMSALSISVVIPTADRPDYLVEAVESALAQSAGVLEVIVIDDASRVDPAPVLTRFGDKVRYDRLPEKGGANVARNRGIELARGSHVAFLDDDDIWLPDKVEAQLEAMAGGYEACLCMSQEIGKSRKPAIDAREVSQDDLRRRTPCGTSGLLATREVLNAERFDPAIPRGQDWDLFVRLVQRRPLAFVGRQLYLRRTGHDRITTAAARQTPAELLATGAAIYKHRAWLGEPAFRRRLAKVLLTFIAQRPAKVRFIAAAIRHAGLRATGLELLKKSRDRKSERRRRLGAAR